MSSTPLRITLAHFAVQRRDGFPGTRHSRHGKRESIVTRSLFVVAMVLCANLSSAEVGDTFSIVAVDPRSGEVGAAGASCVDLVELRGYYDEADETPLEGETSAAGISLLVPGKGAIVAQSLFDTVNKQNGGLRIAEGLGAQAVIEWLIANDSSADFFENTDPENAIELVEETVAWRQYGLVTMDRDKPPESAAFTGEECLDYKGALLGFNYAIQGNALLDESVLKRMERGFLESGGGLAEKLMAALQGANFPGADRRCLEYGVSSLFAFIRVARPEDTAGRFYVDLGVITSPGDGEPIDLLQTEFESEFLKAPPKSR